MHISARKLTVCKGAQYRYNGGVIRSLFNVSGLYLFVLVRAAAAYRPGIINTD